MALREWMRRWATGVAVVTAREGERDFGLTVNAFLSVSLNPPTVLVSLGEEANTTPVISRTKHFAINVLRADQANLSRRFAQPDPSRVKFDGVGLQRGPYGLALLDGTLGSLVCQVSAEYAAGDHRLVLGTVVAFEKGHGRLPLIFFGGGYGEAGERGAVHLPPL